MASECQRTGDRRPERGQEAQNFHKQLKQLVQDMSKDKDVIQGNGLARFQQARTQLETAVSGLITWLTRNSTNLADGSKAVQTADTSSSDTFSSAGSGLGAMINFKA